MSHFLSRRRPHQQHQQQQQQQQQQAPSVSPNSFSASPLLPSAADHSSKGGSSFFWQRSFRFLKHVLQKSKQQQDASLVDKRLPRRWQCLFIVMLMAFLLLTLFCLDGTAKSDSTFPSEQCALQDAFQNGDFWVGSHRTLADAASRQLEPTTSSQQCLDGLRHLLTNGIFYLDLDLIYDALHDQLVVAHPMEFQGTTQFYSPCAKQPLETVLTLLEDAATFVSNSNSNSNSNKSQQKNPSWFVSLEPKADWERTSTYDRNGNMDPTALLQEPLVLLEQTLAVLKKLNIQPTQCALYIDLNKLDTKPKEQDSTPELDIVTQHLTRYCRLALAMKRSDRAEDLLPRQPLSYDYLVPTIEFHPAHPNHAATTGQDSLQKIQTSLRHQNNNLRVIYWIVDTAEDLERVAELLVLSAPAGNSKLSVEENGGSTAMARGGIVSNQPLEMVRILSAGSWCPDRKSSPPGLLRSRQTGRA